jgi:hypothetical protein
MKQDIAVAPMEAEDTRRREIMQYSKFGSRVPGRLPLICASGVPADRGEDPGDFRDFASVLGGRCSFRWHKSDTWQLWRSATGSKDGAPNKFAVQGAHDALTFSPTAGKQTR